MRVIMKIVIVRKMLLNRILCSSPAMSGRVPFDERITAMEKTMKLITFSRNKLNTQRG